MYINNYVSVSYMVYKLVLEYTYCNSSQVSFNLSLTCLLLRVFKLMFTYISIIYITWKSQKATKGDHFQEHWYFSFCMYHICIYVYIYIPSNNITKIYFMCLFSLQNIDLIISLIILFNRCWIKIIFWGISINIFSPFLYVPWYILYI